MVYVVPLGLALIFALVTILVVFFLSEDNGQSRCKAMFLIYLLPCMRYFFLDISFYLWYNITILNDKRGRV